MSNPIYYKDLIAPDGSITTLIDQLEKLITKYGELKSKIQSDAASLAGSLNGVSSATEDQRAEIERLTRETERLTRQYNQVCKEQQKARVESLALNQAKREQRQIDKLLLQLNSSAEGSYNRLSAQYRLNKIRLNEMSAAERQGTEAGKALEKQTYDIYQSMIKLQEATGKHQLSVGNYAKSLNGLNFAAVQVARELPSLAVSSSTFFLAISNNLPILADQIQLLREQNKALIAEGKQGINVFKAVVKSFLSWNTVLTLVITAFTLVGDKILDFISNLFKSKQQIDINTKSLTKYKEALLDINKAERQSITESSTLYSITTDVTRSLEDRRKAAKKMQELYPEYLANFSEEEIMTGKAKSGYDKLTDSLIEYAQTKAALSKITELQTERLDFETELETAKTEYDKLVAEYNDFLERYRDDETFRSVNNLFGNITEYQAQKSKEIQKSRDEIQRITDEITSIDKATEKLRGKVKPELIGDTTKPTGESQKATEKKPMKDNTLEFLRAAEDARIELMEDGMEKEIELNRVKYEREIQDLEAAIATEENLTIEGQDAINEQILYLLEIRKVKEQEIRDKYAKKEEEATAKAQAEEAKRNTEAAKKREADAKKEAEDRRNRYNEYMALFDQEYDLRMSEIDLMNETEREKTRLRLEAEKERLQKILDLNKTGLRQLSDLEIKTIENTIKAIDKESKQLPYDNMWDLLGIGLDPEQQEAMNTVIDSVMSSISSLIRAWEEAAEARLETARQQVEAAQSALDAEIEARNNGYANNVLQAQKDLDLAKETEAAALKEKKKAQKAQIALDTATQTSSLITAAANLWMSLSPLGVIGIAAAIAGIATMFGSFAAAKVKAVQAVNATEQYGDGTVELLQGGSHASGNDIDLGTKPDGTRRRAEGGEYFAVINKRNSKKFGNLIPDVINAFNDGTFTEKYQRANDQMSGYVFALSSGGSTDVSNLEKDVRAIKQQGSKSQLVDRDGNIIEVYKNLTRKIIKS